MLSNCIANLKKGKWTEKNFQALKQLIQEKAFQNNYAVFDWDFTCIFYDVQDNLFIYQVENLKFKLTPSEFSKTIREAIPQDIPFRKWFCLEDQIVTAGKLSKDLDELYSFIYKNYEGFEGKMNLEEIQSTKEFLEFKVKFIALAYGAEELNGRDICQSVSTGFTIEELSALAEKSIDAALKDEIKVYTIQSKEALGSSHSGIVQASYRKGIRVRPEIQNLFFEFQKNGIEVFVCSASQEVGPRVFATNPKYGYGIKADCVFGRRRILKDGKITDEYSDEIPPTYKQGKAKTIKEVIAPRYSGKAPILIAGDSDGDFYMMDAYKNEATLLILDREQTPKMKIYSFIKTAENKNEEKILFQKL